MDRKYIRYIGSKGGLNLAKLETPDRYDRSSGYKAKIRGVRITEFKKYGSLNVSLIVGNYNVYVEYENFKYLLESKLRKGIDLKLAVSQVVNYLSTKSTVRVFCSCADFTYRYKYLATKRGYLNHATNQEKRYPEVRNPNLKGFACKHVIAALNNSKKILSIISPYIIAKLIDYYGYEEVTGDMDE